MLKTNPVKGLKIVIIKFITRGIIRILSFSGLPSSGLNHLQTKTHHKYVSNAPVINNDTCKITAIGISQVSGLLFSMQVNVSKVNCSIIAIDVFRKILFILSDLSRLLLAIMNTTPKKIIETIFISIRRYKPKIFHLIGNLDN
jgi:hypothetical protein